MYLYRPSIFALVKLPYKYAAAAAAKSLQSCPTLCDPIDGSPPGSPVPGVLQARILEWVAFSFSRGSSQSRDPTQVSCVAGGFLTSWATDQFSRSLCSSMNRSTPGLPVLTNSWSPPKPKSESVMPSNHLILCHPLLLLPLIFPTREAQLWSELLWKKLWP